MDSLVFKSHLKAVPPCGEPNGPETFPLNTAETQICHCGGGLPATRQI